MKLYGTYFCGNKASDYAIENGYLDYGTLAKAFDAVLNNQIMLATYDIGYWEQTSGFVDNRNEIELLEEKIDEFTDRLYDLEVSEMEESVEYQLVKEELEEMEERKQELEEEETLPEIFQYFIVSDNGAEILEECNEIVFYNKELDMYLWGVTHFGTSWDYVLTDIKLNCKE